MKEFDDWWNDFVKKMDNSPLITDVHKRIAKLAFESAWNMQLKNMIKLKDEHISTIKKITDALIL
jgi:Na+-transporting NADH:ubiquinone oxidoreductase subunit NqrA